MVTRAQSREEMKEETLCQAKDKSSGLWQNSMVSGEAGTAANLGDGETHQAREESFGKQPDWKTRDQAMLVEHTKGQHESNI